MSNDEIADKTPTKNPGATTLQQSFLSVTPNIPMSSNRTTRAMDVSFAMATPLRKEMTGKKLQACRFIPVIFFLSYFRDHRKTTAENDSKKRQALIN